MSAADCFFDTNVLLYLLSKDAAKADRAEALLTWLGDHRTDAGSFPEKVLYDGRPAAVAPLAWTAALVVIARHELVHG